jgi:hypothetical protein
VAFDLLLELEAGGTAVTTNPNDIDMSPAALRRRLEEMRALYKLMTYLRRAKLDIKRA